MTKTQLVNAIAESMEGTSKTHVRAFIDALGNVATKTLKKEKNFVLPGLVKLVVVDVAARPERMARNPATGEQMKVPAKAKSKKLKARFLKALKVEVGQLQAAPAAKTAAKKK